MKIYHIYIDLLHIFKTTAEQYDLLFEWLVYNGNSGLKGHFFLFVWFQCITLEEK